MKGDINMEKWENLGDVNFLSYGGCLVKHNWEEPDESLKYCYTVFYLNPEAGENGDQNYAAQCFIDLTDSWLDYDGMLQSIGCDEFVGMSFEDLIKKIDPMVLAKELIEYHGVANFSPEVQHKEVYLQYPSQFEDFIVSDEELTDWLKNIGAEEFI